MDIYGIKTQGFDITCVWLLSQSCPILSKSVDCSAPVFPVLHYLPKSAQTHVHLVSNAIQSSHPVAPFSCPQYFPASGSFPVSHFFASGGQGIGVSASTSVLPVIIQSWFPLGLTGLISLQSKGFSRVFFNKTVRKH